MNIILFFFFSLLSSEILAKQAISFGSMAANITEPIDIVAGFVSVACLLLGVCCLFASLVKYLEHRRSPLFIPISTVLWLVIIGLLLLILPFAYVITGNGVPLSALWGGS